MTRVGVLALQGDFAAHGRVLQALGIQWREVRTPQDLSQVDALILPGGESSTLLKLLHSSHLWTALEAFHAAGRPLFGTCAGLILLARETRCPKQESLGCIDIVAARNAYGRQIDSFIDKGQILAPDELSPEPLEMVFIRAPKIVTYGPQVKALATCRGEVVLARQAHVLVAAFHPELSDNDRVHRYFLRLGQGT
jgi:5'-phosphate synthase pdxT subunit